MIIIGEKINGSIPVVADAIAKRDAEFIKNRARVQAEAGATYIDCCASVPEAEEVETLKWMIDCIQEATDLPISLDSPSAEVLAEIFPYCNKSGLINSVSGEGTKIDTIFSKIADTDWEVICLLSDDTGIPRTAGDRLRVFDNIMKSAESYGIKPSRLHIDPLVEMLCTSEDGIAMVEEVMDSIRSRYPDIHITGAVSNISFNLPYRKILNQSFTVLSMYSGLDSAIFDPLNKALMGMIAATEAIMAKGPITEDEDLSDIIASMKEENRQYVYPAYVILAMKAGVIPVEVDEEWGEVDVESIFDELKESGKLELDERDFYGLLFATVAMLGQDDMCMGYIGGFRDELFGPVKK